MHKYILQYLLLFISYPMFCFSDYTESTQLVSMGNGFSILKNDGTLLFYRVNMKKINESSNPKEYIDMKNFGTGWKSVANGNQYVLMIKNDGSLWSYGVGAHGELGRKNINQDNELQIGNEYDWIQIAAGSDHSVAIKNDGSLWAWGSNYCGKVSNDYYGNQFYPVKIGEYSKYIKVEAGYDHTGAIDDFGSLFSWGCNDSGQLGNGGYENKGNPEHIGINHNFVRVSCGYDHALALKNDGTIWSFGSNIKGQLGIGNTVTSTIPKKISGQQWKHIDAGSFQSVAIKSDGTLWFWGLVDAKNSPNNENFSIKTPVQLGKDNDWIKAALGDGFIVLLKKNGTLWISFVDINNPNFIEIKYFITDPSSEKENPVNQGGVVTN